MQKLRVYIHQRDAMKKERIQRHRLLLGQETPVSSMAWTENQGTMSPGSFTVVSSAPSTPWSHVGSGQRRPRHQRGPARQAELQQKWAEMVQATARMHLIREQDMMGHLQHMDVRMLSKFLMNTIIFGWVWIKMNSPMYKTPDQCPAVTRSARRKKKKMHVSWARECADRLRKMFMILTYAWKRWNNMETSKRAKLMELVICFMSLWNMAVVMSVKFFPCHVCCLLLNVKA